MTSNAASTPFWPTKHYASVWDVVRKASDTELYHICKCGAQLTKQPKSSTGNVVNHLLSHDLRKLPKPAAATPAAPAPVRVTGDYFMSASTLSKQTPSVPSTLLTMSDSSLTTAFTDFGALLERESDEIEQINKHVRDLHRINRTVSSHLQSIHTATSPATLATIAQSATTLLLQHALPVLASLSALVAQLPPYRYNNFYNTALQTTTLHLILAHYCTHHTLLSHSHTQHTLHLLPHLAYDTEDYLYAVSGLGKELVRLAVNGVRGGWVAVVAEVSTFLHDLYGGFRLLNLRNDGLRRRVDGLKYDVLRAEEIMYDLTVRGLLGGSGGGGGKSGGGGSANDGVVDGIVGQSGTVAAIEGTSGIGSGGSVSMKDTDTES